MEQGPCALVRRTFRVCLALKSISSNVVVATQYGDATKRKIAKQLAATKHIESLLRTFPEALYLLLNRQDRKQVRVVQSARLHGRRRRACAASAGAHHLVTTPLVCSVREPQRGPRL